MDPQPPPDPDELIPPPPPEWFYIKSQLNDFVLEEQGSGNALIVNPAGDNDGQKWKWVGNSIVSKNNLAIDMMGPIRDDWRNGAEMIAWPPHNGENQIWRFDDDKLTDMGGSRFVLEIEDSMPIMGTKIIANYDKGKQEQFWNLENTGEAVDP